MAVSAGLLMFRTPPLEVLLVHPGGPFWRNKDVWTIPKGEVDGGEDLLACAIREMEEETGIVAEGPYLPLGRVRQKGGKVVHAWAFRGQWDGVLRSNEFELEWPPRSGRRQRFPEVDRAAFFAPDEARARLNPAQVPLVDRLVEELKAIGAGRDVTPP